MLVFCGTWSLSLFDSHKCSKSTFFCLDKHKIILFMPGLAKSLWKQLTFLDLTTGFPTKWCLKNECRNSILLWQVTTQIWLLIGWSKFLLWHNQSEALTWIVVHHNFTYGISALVSQTSFRGETSGGVMKVLAVFLRLCLLWALHLSPFYQNNVKNVEIINVVTIWPGLWCPIGFIIINHSCFIAIP